MIGLLQRVSRASVSVDGQKISEIDHGLLLLVGVVREDDEADADKLAERVANYRVFADNHGKMNLNVQQAAGAVLAVPQFTLAADTSRGRRPSFGHAAEPARGRALFERFCSALRAQGLDVPTGEFGADMQVELVNDGPVTFWLSTR